MTRKSQQLQIRVTPEEKYALKRMATAAGLDVSSYVLSKVLPAVQREFSRLTRLLGDEQERRFALAELNDLLSGLSRAELAEAVQRADLSRLPLLVQNYVAAMVEQAAHERGLAPPAWVTGTRPLEEPHFFGGLKSLRPHLLRAAPVAFKRRNIFVDSTVGDRV
jgi:uncharacterized protein (DUF1778 family)